MKTSSVYPTATNTVSLSACGSLRYFKQIEGTSAVVPWKISPDELVNHGITLPIGGECIVIKSEVPGTVAILHRISLPVSYLGKVKIWALENSLVVGKDYLRVSRMPKSLWNAIKKGSC